MRLVPASIKLTCLQVVVLHVYAWPFGDVPDTDAFYGKPKQINKRSFHSVTEKDKRYHRKQILPEMVNDILG
jgi:hypothetical protein